MEKQKFTFNKRDCSTALNLTLASLFMEGRNCWFWVFVSFISISVLIVAFSTMNTDGFCTYIIFFYSIVFLLHYIWKPQTVWIYMGIRTCVCVYLVTKEIEVFTIYLHEHGLSMNYRKSVLIYGRNVARNTQLTFFVFIHLHFLQAFSIFRRSDTENGKEKWREKNVHTDRPDTTKSALFRYYYIIAFYCESKYRICVQNCHRNYLFGVIHKVNGQKINIQHYVGIASHPIALVRK